MKCEGRLCLAALELPWPLVGALPLGALMITYVRGMCVAGEGCSSVGIRADQKAPGAELVVEEAQCSRIKQRCLWRKAGEKSGASR